MSKKALKNEEIRSAKVRLIIEDGESRVCSRVEAVGIARGMGLDLVEIAPNAQPPVCKVMDYNKYVFEQKRRTKEQNKKQQESRIDIKEIRLSPNIGEHDLEFKTRHAENFLKKNNKVKVTLQFKGRNIQFKERGEQVLLEFAQRLVDLGIPESMPKMENKRMFFTIKPKK